MDQFLQELSQKKILQSVYLEPGADQINMMLDGNFTLETEIEGEKPNIYNVDCTFTNLSEIVLRSKFYSELNNVALEESNK